MVDKGKLKKFLNCDHSDDIKLFVITILKCIIDSPTVNGYYAIYLYDLDIFEEGFIKLPTTQYYLIDFKYLNELSPKVRTYYLDILLDDNSVLNTVFLVEHGILISDIEYLKLKRQQKLNKIKRQQKLNKIKNESDPVDDDCDYDIFDLY